MKLDRLEFHALPTRPMVDLSLDYCPPAMDLGAYLKKGLAKMNPDAIVRFKSSPDRGLPPEQKGKLTHALLKSLVPETMNYQFSGALSRSLMKGEAP